MRRAANTYAENPEPLSLQATEDAVLQVLLETGATGLEPATSGVTGHFGGHDD
jgi:hypothetical protein